MRKSFKFKKEKKKKWHKAEKQDVCSKRSEGDGSEVHTEAVRFQQPHVSSEELR